MTEPRIIQRTKEITGKLHAGMTKKGLHRELDVVLGSDGKSIYERRLESMEIGSYTLTVLPPTVQGDYAGQAPYIRLERRDRKSSEILTSVTFYPEGKINRGRREYIVAIGGKVKKERQVNSEEAFKLASSEIGRLTREGILTLAINSVRSFLGKIHLPTITKPAEVLKPQPSLETVRS